MCEHFNEHEQPIGRPLPDWSPPAVPSPIDLVGRTCVLSRLSLKHVSDLFEADSLDPSGKAWTYMPFGPFESEQDLAIWIERASQWENQLFYGIIDASSKRTIGFAAYLRVAPDHGCLEIGAIYFSPLLRRTTASTEAMYLMLTNAFDELGYRRCEWKCDHLNEPSRSAALRLGFEFEGTFRDAVVYKSRNRDTDWFSITATRWPAVRNRLQAWLAPDNFDERGAQKRRLSDISDLSADP